MNTMRRGGQKQRSGFSTPNVDSEHVRKQHAERDRLNSEFDEMMARLGGGSTDSQSAGGAETKAPKAAAPAAEPATQHRGVTPEGTARVEDAPQRAMAIQGSSSPSPRPRVPGSIETDPVRADTERRMEEARARREFTCACVISTAQVLAHGVEACRFICVRPESPSLYADSQCIRCYGHGFTPSWLERRAEPAGAATNTPPPGVALANLERRAKHHRGSPPDGAREIPGFPTYFVTNAGEVYRGSLRLAEFETPGGLRAVRIVAADGTHTSRTVERLLHDVWGIGEKPKKRTRKIRTGRCPWLDGCSDPSAPIKNGTHRATPREIADFCAKHRHVLRVSPPQRDRHGIPHTLSYDVRISVGSRARAIATPGPIDGNAARLLLELIDSAGGIERVRELAGGAS